MCNLASLEHTKPRGACLVRPIPYVKLTVFLPLAYGIVPSTYAGDAMLRLLGYAKDYSYVTYDFENGDRCRLPLG